MRKGFKVHQVSQKKQEFVRGKAGTQTADSRWKSLQSWIPRSVTTLRRGRINQELMKYVRSWQWRFAKQHYSAEFLGESMRQRLVPWGYG